MPFNIPTSPINMTYNPIYNPSSNNINLTQLNAPLLVSSVFSGTYSPLSSFINYEYQDNELSNMEEGLLLPTFTRIFDKKNNSLHLFSFSDKGKKIKKITL